jgi:arabinan endo-1,5-alpha-L-arabinosidase
MHVLSTCLVALAAARVVDAEAMYSNPVHHGDTPDPGVAFDNTTNKFWAATTGTVGKNAFPLWSSTDLTSWTSEGYIFPDGHAPKWSTTEYWAPELHFVGGTWTVYFTALKQGAMLSVGCAKSTSKSIAGPYEDIGAPIFAETDWGNIGKNEGQLMLNPGNDKA